MGARFQAQTRGNSNITGSQVAASGENNALPGGFANWNRRRGAKEIHPHRSVNMTSFSSFSDNSTDVFIK